MNDSTQNISELRDEAASAGDMDMVAICDRALDGDQEAIAACERAIETAWAQHDES